MNDFNDNKNSPPNAFPVATVIGTYNGKPKYNDEHDDDEELPTILNRMNTWNENIHNRKEDKYKDTAAGVESTYETEDPNYVQKHHNIKKLLKHEFKLKQGLFGKAVKDLKRRTDINYITNRTNRGGKRNKKRKTKKLKNKKNKSRRKQFRSIHNITYVNRHIPQENTRLSIYSK